MRYEFTAVWTIQFGTDRKIISLFLTFDAIRLARWRLTFVATSDLPSNAVAPRLPAAAKPPLAIGDDSGTTFFVVAKNVKNHRASRDGIK
jgi:hypothetical protein